MSHFCTRFREIPMLNPRLVTHSIFSHEHSQPIPNNILCSGNSDNTLSLGSYQLTFTFQSGQSLIEHSYRADSDLSPAGWEYSERLKEFVLERRAKSLEQRGINAKDRRLVVHIFSFFCCTLPLIYRRYGRPLGVAHTTPRGLF